MIAMTFLFALELSDSEHIPEMNRGIKTHMENNSMSLKETSKYISLILRDEPWDMYTYDKKTPQWIELGRGEFEIYYDAVK